LFKWAAIEERIGNDRRGLRNFRVPIGASFQERARCGRRAI